MIATNALPPIVVTEADYDRLSNLAERTARHLPKVASFLSSELERAQIVTSRAVPTDVVTMNSRVAFRMAITGLGHVVTLVYPSEADMLQGRLSILTPIGTALLGLSAGQTMSWEDRTGERKALILQQVIYQPQAAGHAVTV